MERDHWIFVHIISPRKPEDKEDTPRKLPVAMFSNLTEKKKKKKIWMTRVSPWYSPDRTNTRDTNDLHTRGPGK